MKIILRLVLGLTALCLAGCVISPEKMGSDYAKFINAIPGATITDIATKTQSPFWTFDASASGISTDSGSGIMTVTNGKAAFAIPLWGFSKTFSVSGLTLKATSAQLAAAAALTAAASIPKPQ